METLLGSKPCLCGAFPAPSLLRSGPLSPLTPDGTSFPRTALLLIYRIQSHTHPKRRKFCLKHAGQKSVKKELPERRKGPKRAVECWLKVQTHVWEDTPGQSHNFISGCCAVGSAPALGARCWKSESLHLFPFSLLFTKFLGLKYYSISHHTAYCCWSARGYNR